MCGVDCGCAVVLCIGILGLWVLVGLIGLWQCGEFACSRVLLLVFVSMVLAGVALGVLCCFWVLVDAFGLRVWCGVGWC